MVYFLNEQVFSQGFRLRDNSAVFQAELWAIKAATHYVLDRYIAWPIHYFVDSQASLLALQNERIVSRLVLETVNLLNQVQTMVRLVWVPAHSGVVGNEVADDLAKNSVDLEYVQEVPLPKVQIKNMVWIF